MCGPPWIFTLKPMLHEGWSRKSWLLGEGADVWSSWSRFSAFDRFIEDRRQGNIPPSLAVTSFPHFRLRPCFKPSGLETD